jgi:hypothetical protein
MYTKKKVTIGAEGLICMLSDKIDKELIEAAGNIVFYEKVPTF